MIVAQQFTAGKRAEGFVVRESDGRMMTLGSSTLSAVRFTDFISG
jgi:hypothetical protein